MPNPILLDSAPPPEEKSLEHEKWRRNEANIVYRVVKLPPPLPKLFPGPTLYDTYANHIDNALGVIKNNNLTYSTQIPEKLSKNPN